METNKQSYEWLVQGVLAKLGTILDRWLGRGQVVKSGLATSELAERLKQLLDEKAREVPGKGTLVPHNLSLKLQWDKFSDESEETMHALESELCIAAVDHINDSLYLTYAPVSVTASLDYFTQGVSLGARFDNADEAGDDLTFPDSSSLINAPEDERTEEVLSTLVASVQGHQAVTRKIVLPASRRVSIGRAAANDLQIDDASMSKIHATLLVDVEGQMTVADTGSTNGTSVNGERIAYGTAVAVPAGAVVRFGSVDMTFQLLELASKVEPSGQ